MDKHFSLLQTFANYVCKTFYDIATRLLKQDGAKMSKIPLRNIKIVFFNLLVDVGKVSYADKAVPW